MRDGDLSPNRRDVDDASRAAAAHVGQGGQNAEERTPEVGAQRVFKIGDGHVLEWAHFDDTGVVDENVDDALLGDHALHGGLDLGSIPDVAANDRWRDATTGEIESSALELLLVACGECHACAFSDELAGDHQAKPSRTAKDENRLAREVNC